jgi:hypothetical protein
MDIFGPKKSYVLFLANVFPEDCADDNDVLKDIEDSCQIDLIESSFDQEYERITDPSTDNDCISEEEDLPDFFHSEMEGNDNTGTHNGHDPSGIFEEYDSLPEYFIDIDTWPKSINSLCWGCALKIYGVPYFIPIGKVKKSISITSDSDHSSNEPKTEDYSTIFENMADFTNIPDIYKTPSRTKEIHALVPHGRFCHEKCAQRYINRVKDPKIKNIWEASELLKYLYEKIMGKSVQFIPEAEDPMEMIQFSGPKGITAQEYRERNDNKKVILSEKI